MSDSNTPRRHADVAIVGLGPVGTLLAGLLGRRGLEVLVIEQDTTVFPLPRAAHIDHTGLRTLQDIGCLDAVLPSMIPNPGIDIMGADGELITQLPGNQSTWSGVPTSVYFHQPGFDSALRAAVSTLPTVRVELGSTVTAVEQDDDQVTLTVEGDGAGTYTASYLIGCDGATSAVRENAGLALDDFGFHEQWLVVDLILASSDHGLPKHAEYACQPSRPHVVIPMPAGRHRVEFMVLPGEDIDEIQQPAQVQAILTALIGPLDAEVERAAVYTFHGLVARQWRSGRILLAGDAAHQMPPFLGQGMCSGFRDATNLAWKLEHVLRRDAPTGLLDLYQQERSPHVGAVITRAITYGAVICELDPVVAAGRDVALRNDPSPLMFSLPPLSPGPLVLEGGGRLFGQPRVGGQALDDLIGPRFLVLARDVEHLGASGQWWMENIGAWVTTLDEVVSDDGSLERWFDDRQVDVVVVRPDRYILAAKAGGLDELTHRVKGTLVDSGHDVGSNLMTSGGVAS